MDHSLEAAASLSSPTAAAAAAALANPPGSRLATAPSLTSAASGAWADPTGGGRYTLLYKAGDDLRQDQLVVQMMSLMDRLLKRENLDLKLNTYRCVLCVTHAPCTNLTAPAWAVR